MRPDDAEAVTEVAKRSVIDFSGSPSQAHVFLDGRDVSGEIRTPEVSELGLARRRRAGRAPAHGRMAARDGRARPLVGRGRDLGTVVFPDADVKIYLDADLDTRAKRCCRELQSRGIAVSLDDVREDLGRRDHRDKSREDSPLKAAPDAVPWTPRGLDPRGRSPPSSRSSAVIRAVPQSGASVRLPRPEGGGRKIPFIRRPEGPRPLGVCLSLLYSASPVFQPFVALATGTRFVVARTSRSPGVHRRLGTTSLTRIRPSSGSRPSANCSPAKEELFRQPLLGPLITAYNAIPIRRGKADVGMARAMEVLEPRPRDDHVPGRDASVTEIFSRLDPVCGL